MKKRLLSSFSYTFLASLIGFGFNFIIAKALGAKVYGEIVYYVSFASLIGLLVSINYSSLYMGSKITRKNKNTYSLFFTIETIAFSIISLPAYFIIFYYIQDRFKTVIILLVCYFMTITSTSAMEYNSNKDVSRSILLGSLFPRIILVIVFSIALIIGFRSSLYYLYGMFFSYGIITIYSITKFRPKFYLDTSIFRRAWKFYFLGIIGTGFTYVFQIIQKEYGSYEELATLSIALLFFTGLGLMDRVLVKFALPKVHEYFEAGNIDKIGELYSNNTFLSIMLNLPILVWVTFNIDLIAMILGKSYKLLPDFFSILLVGYFANMITGITGYLLRATEHEKFEMYNEVTRTVVGLVAFFLLKDCQYGVPIALSLSMLVYNVLKYVEIYYLYRFVPIRLDRKSIYYILIVALSFFVSNRIDNLYTKIITDIFLFSILYLILFKYIKDNRDIFKGYM